MTSGACEDVSLVVALSRGAGGKLVGGKSGMDAGRSGRCCWSSRRVFGSGCDGSSGGRLLLEVVIWTSSSMCLMLWSCGGAVKDGAVEVGVVDGNGGSDGGSGALVEGSGKGAGGGDG